MEKQLPTELSGIDKGLKDIEDDNVFYAKDSADLVKQIFCKVDTGSHSDLF